MAGRRLRALLAWLAMVAIPVQGVALVLSEVRGPAHYHSDAEEGHAHAHEHLEHHHHAPGAHGVVADHDHDHPHDAQSGQRTASAFDVLSATEIALSPPPRRQRAGSLEDAFVPAGFSRRPERPPDRFAPQGLT